MKKALAFTLFFGIVFSMPAWALTGPEWLNKGLSSTDPDYKIECYTNAIDAGGLHKRTEFTIYALRGDAYTQKGQRDLAVKDYNKAIELNPDNQDMYKRRDALLPENAPRGHTSDQGHARGLKSQSLSHGSLCRDNDPIYQGSQAEPKGSGSL